MIKKTHTDYVKEAIEYFKNEYDKIKLKGLKYKYELGESSDDLLKLYNIEDCWEDIDIYDYRLEAIKNLESVGFIKNFKIVAGPSQDAYSPSINFAECLIDEEQLLTEGKGTTKNGIENIFTKTQENRYKDSEIERFLNLLSQQFIQSMTYSISDGRLWKKEDIILNEYRIILKYDPIIFKNKNIAKQFKEFNKKFKELFMFIGKTFWYDEGNTFLSLYPDQRHSTKGEDAIFWMEEKIKLDEIIKEFEKEYLELIKQFNTYGVNHNKEEIKVIHEFENSIQEKSLNVNIIKEIISKTKGPKEPNDYQKSKKIEKSFEGLAYWTDGSITFNGKDLILRSQLRDLLRLFISGPNKIMTFDDIKDTIIEAYGRGKTKNSTISKYINELREELKKYTTNIVIKNEKDTGYKIVKI